MSDHVARAGRVRTAAAVLILSGALIGGTLDRVSIWLLPGQGVPPQPGGQISRALEPPVVGGTQPAEKAPAAPDEKVRAGGPLPEIAEPPSAPTENAMREPERPKAERPPGTPTTPGQTPNESKPDAVAAPPQPPQPSPPAPSVRLLNPGAVQTETANEKPTQGTRATKDKAAARNETAPRRRERRAASDADEDSPAGREREPQRDYRSLREEMLRR